MITNDQEYLCNKASLNVFGQALVNLFYKFAILNQISNIEIIFNKNYEFNSS